MDKFCFYAPGDVNYDKLAKNVVPYVDKIKYGSLLEVNKVPLFGYIFYPMDEELNIYEAFWFVKMKELKGYGINWELLCKQGLAQIGNSVLLGRVPKTKEGRAANVLSKRLGFQVVQRGQYCTIVRYQKG